MNLPGLGIDGDAVDDFLVVRFGDVHNVLQCVGQSLGVGLQPVQRGDHRLAVAAEIPKAVKPPKEPGCDAR